MFFSSTFNLFSSLTGFIQFIVIEKPFSIDIMSQLRFCLLDDMRFHISFVSGQYLCFFFSSFSIFAEKFLFLLILLFVFFLGVFLMEDLVSAVMRHGIMQFI